MMAPAGEMWSVVTESPRRPAHVHPRCRQDGSGSVAWRRSTAGCARTSSRRPRRTSRPGGDSRLRQLVVTGEHVGVAGREHVGLDALRRRPPRSAPSSARCRADRPAARPGRCRAARGEVDVHGAGEGVRDHQRRGQRKFILHSGWIRPSKLRLPDSTEHDRQVVLGDRVADLLDERAGVADARGATVADEIEAECREGRARPGRSSRSRPGIPARARSSPTA